MLADLRAAFMLLTRLPVGSAGPPDLARCVWAFPLVGLVINGAGGLIYWAANTAGVPPLLAAIWTLAGIMILTGGLHEDGLADTADGFGGGATPDRKLEIMRDSRIGSYGAAALILTTLLRAAALATIARPAAVLPALVTAGMIGRAAMIVPLTLLPPARSDGLGASVRHPTAPIAGSALILAVLAAMLLHPAGAALAAIGLSLAAGIGIIELTRRQIGGYTGDVLGAIEVVAECVVLTVLGH